MTNSEKKELRELARKGYSFERIRKAIGYASDATIRKYIKIFNPQSRDD